MDAEAQLKELQKTIDQDDEVGMQNQRNVSRATAKSKQGGREPSEQKIKLLKVNVQLTNGEKAQVNRLTAPRQDG